MKGVEKNVDCFELVEQPAVKKRVDFDQALFSSKMLEVVSCLDVSERTNKVIELINEGFVEEVVDDLGLEADLEWERIYEVLLERSRGMIASEIRFDAVGKRMYYQAGFSLEMVILADRLRKDDVATQEKWVGRMIEQGYAGMSIVLMMISALKLNRNEVAKAIWECRGGVRLVERYLGGMDDLCEELAIAMIKRGSMHVVQTHFMAFKKGYALAELMVRLGEYSFLFERYDEAGRPNIDAFDLTTEQHVELVSQYWEWLALRNLELKKNLEVKEILDRVHEKFLMWKGNKDDELVEELMYDDLPNVSDYVEVCQDWDNDVNLPIIECGADGE